VGYDFDRKRDCLDVTASIDALTGAMQKTAAAGKDAAVESLGRCERRQQVVGFGVWVRGSQFRVQSLGSDRNSGRGTEDWMTWTWTPNLTTQPTYGPDPSLIHSSAVLGLR
jgi:hypothetical protein